MTATPPATTYDALPYPSYPFAVTHPDRLHVLARLCGLAAAPVERCRILELGCAAGGNLLPIALDYPEARLVGVDLSGRQVEEGRALVRRLGVTNLDLRHASILDVDDTWGRFDYVVCHGVYSWVPEPVQRKILEVCARNLAPDGVAYVSYNVLPGWRMRGMIRDMMRYHARQFAEPLVAVAQARKLLQYLARNVNVATPYGLLLQQEARGLEDQSDAYLFHEHLEDTNEPLFLHQFLARADAAGLKFMGEAGPGETHVTLSPRLPEGAARGSAPAIETEQYRDFVRNRLFRASLLVHRDRPLGGDARWEDLPGLLLSAQLDLHEAKAEDAPRLATPPPEVPRFDPRTGTALEPATPATPPGRGALAVFETRHGRLLHAFSPLLVAVARELHARWPQAVPFDVLLAAARAQLGQSGPAPAEERESIARDLLEVFADDVIELRPHLLRLAAEVSARPVASPLVRAQVVDGVMHPTNQRHEAMQIDRFEAQLLRRLDGTQDVAALAAAMVECTRRGELEVNRDDAPIADEVELLRLFTIAVPMKLGILCRKSLLIG